jgi:hypothetical protein
VAGIALALAVAGPALGQTLPQDPGPFPPLRQDADTSKPVDPAAPVYDRWRHISLGDDPTIYLSLGGELRERYEHYRGAGFGLFPVKDDDYLLQRILLHGDLHLGDHARVFVQFGSHYAFGKKKPLAPVDEDRIDLQQAFIDLSTPIAGVGDGTLRIGRQELLIGSGRFIDIREGPNVRQSHDGVRATLRLAGGGQVDGWVVRPVLNRIGAFDDKWDRRQLFAGLYTSWPLIAAAPSARPGPPPPPVLGLDAYFLELDTDRTPFVGGLFDEKRRTLGARLFGRKGAFDYDIEGLYQFGTVGPADIRAGGVAGHVGYTIASLPWSPRLGVKSGWFSGDHNPDDRVAGSFNPLFPRGGYFSEPGLQTFANLVDVFPSLTLNPTPRLAIQGGVDFTWRESTRDAVYVAPDIPLSGTAGVPGRYIGTNYMLQTTWTATDHLTLAGSYVHVDAGSAIRNARGSDVDYVALWAQLKF